MEPTVTAEWSSSSPKSTDTFLSRFTSKSLLTVGHSPLLSYIIPVSLIFPLSFIVAMFGVPDEGEPIQDHKFYELATADIVVPRQEAWHLMWDMRVIVGKCYLRDENLPKDHIALH